MSGRKPVLTAHRDQFEIQTFTAGGPGGQHQNRSQTGVRLIHRPSGARGESREHRSQAQNKRAALERLAATPHFQYWVRESLREGPSVEERVEKQMAEKNIRTEIRVDGKWVEIDLDGLV